MKNFLALVLLVLFIPFSSSCSMSSSKIVEDTETELEQNFEETDDTIEVLADSEEEVLSEYTTKLLDKAKNRVHNIKTAGKKIESFVMKPGEIFSFNKTVGVRSNKTGFKKATGLTGKKRTKLYGGGICQLSTTIYQASKAVGLDIKERHEHQKKVSYIGVGEDATVSFGKLDLKIKNNTNFKIKFRVLVNENLVKVTVVKIK